MRVAVTLAGNAAFLPAIGMGAAAAWGAAGIQAAPRVHIALFSPFSFPFPPFGSGHVQTLLVQEEPWDCSHPTDRVTPSYSVRGFPVLPASQVALELPHPSAGDELLLSALTGHCGCHSPWGTTTGGRDFRAVGGRGDIPVPFPVLFPILILFPVPSWSAARDQAESKDQNPLSSLTV